MATDPASTTSLAAALLETITPQEYGDLALKDKPFLAMVPKSEDWYGEDTRRVPLMYAPTGGASVTFTTAQTYRNASKHVKFDIPRVNDYATWALSGAVIEATQNDSKALLKAAKVEFMMAMRSINNSLSQKIWRSGTGTIGVVGSLSTATVTLATIDDIVNFETGMFLQSSATDGGAVISATPLEVISVDRDLGKFTLASTPGGADFGAAKFIYRGGDANGAIFGVQAWVPVTAPSSTAFCGVDRTADLTKLGGQRFDGTGYPVEEAIIRAMARCQRNGAHPDKAFMNPVVMGNLMVELGTKAIRTEGKVQNVSFSGIKLFGGGNEIECFADPNCPTNAIYLLSMKSWMFHSMGKAPRVLNADGVGDMLRIYNADAYEGRLGYRGNLGCNAPGDNMVVSI